MRIGLISPKGNFSSNDPEFRKFWDDSPYTITYRQNWSGLGTGLLIVAALTPPEYDVKLIDENIEPINFSDKYDLVGITAMTQQATRAYQIADEFRKRNIPVTIGGIHATILPEEAKEHCDSVVIGESENTWPILLTDLGRNTLLPFYRADKAVNLKDSPLPRYDLLKKHFYSIVWLQTTRGCPHDCDFCAASKIFGAKYRFKDISQLKQEIELIRKELGDILIGIADDNIAVNKNYLTLLLDYFKQSGIRWLGQSDISIAQDNEMLRMVRKSNCKFLLLGLESISAKNLKAINNNSWKYDRLSNYSTYTRRIQETGIGVMGSFIFGFDHDDITIFKKTAEFVLENNLYYGNFSILTPYPGTRLRERLLKENRLLTTPWEKYTLWDVNFIPKKMSASELQSGLFDAYKMINTREAFEKRATYFKNIFKKQINIL
ncbi:MAG TPA: radical SAM protein [Chitinivibrionales bacterium]|nr:radical SAM protein [Chitinivibrionales bacterium]